MMAQAFVVLRLLRPWPSRGLSTLRPGQRPGRAGTVTSTVARAQASSLATQARVRLGHRDDSNP
eukprot:2799526-Rhodomonas_salina.3